MFNRNQPDDMYQDQQSDFFRQEMGDGQLAYSRERLALYLAKVMGWMCFGLFLTLVSAITCIAVPSILFMLVTSSTFKIGIIVAQFALVLVFSIGLKQMSASVATITFLAYSVVMGMTLSVLLLIFQTTSIISVFGLTAVVFFLMSLYGYLTKKDLTGVGSLCLFGLIGIILANIFNALVFKSAGLDLAIMCIGIVLFIGLIAFDAQKVKDMYIMAVSSGEGEQSETVKKIAIFGAFNLYLDFINLFLRLLYILGRRRN